MWKENVLYTTTAKSLTAFIEHGSSNEAIARIFEKSFNVNENGYQAIQFYVRPNQYGDVIDIWCDDSQITEKLRSGMKQHGLGMWFMKNEIEYFVPVKTETHDVNQLFVDAIEKGIELTLNGEKIDSLYDVRVKLLSLIGDVETRELDKEIEEVRAQLEELIQKRENMKK